MDAALVELFESKRFQLLLWGFPYVHGEQTDILPSLASMSRPASKKGFFQLVLRANLKNLGLVMPSLFHLDHLHIMMFLHRYLGSFQGNPKHVLACHSWVKSIEKIEQFIVDDVLPLLGPCLKSSSLTASLSRVSPSQATCRQGKSMFS